MAECRPAPDDRLARSFRRCGWPWAHVALFALLCVGFSVTPVVNSFRGVLHNKDYSLWYQVGRAVCEGRPLYPDDPAVEFPYLYPPTLAAFVYAPLTQLGLTGFVLGLCALAAASWAASVAFSVRLVAGRWDAHPLLYVLPALATLPYTWDIFLLGQINLTLLALVLGSLLALRHRRPWLAGGLLGLATAMKVFPLSIAAYFVARRRWAAAAGTAVSAALVLALLPAPVRGLDRNWHELGVWASGMFGTGTGERLAQRTDIEFSRRNQSLESVAHRLLRPVVAGDWDGEAYRVNVADLSPAACRLIGWAACLGLGVVILVSARGRFAPSPFAEGMEGSMVVALAVLCSPLAWTYFSCWLLPAWTVAARCLCERRSRGALPLVGFACAGALAASAFTELFRGSPQAYGATAWAGVAFVLTLGVVRWREGSKVRKWHDRPTNAFAANRRWKLPGVERDEGRAEMSQRPHLALSSKPGDGRPRAFGKELRDPE